MANYHKDHSVQTFELRILFDVQTGCSLHKLVYLLELSEDAFILPFGILKIQQYDYK